MRPSCRNFPYTFILPHSFLSCKRLSNIYGIVSITRACVCKKDIEDIKKNAVMYCADSLKKSKSFKVDAKRADKHFQYNSMQIGQIVGGTLHDAIDGLVVDVHNPDVVVRVPVKVPPDNGK